MGVRDFVVRLPLGSQCQCAVFMVMVVLRSPPTHVCLRCRAARFVLTPLYWLNLVLTSLSTLTSS